MGTLTYDKSASIEISQQALFGRHCAVVGTTGGGKSFTVSKLIEGIVSNNGKTILIDATGEYSMHDAKDYSYAPAILSENSFFHYSNLTVGDLFVLLRPSGQVQQPVLLDAIQALKIVHIAKRQGRNISDIRMAFIKNKKHSKSYFLICIMNFHKKLKVKRLLLIFRN